MASHVYSLVLLLEQRRAQTTGTPIIPRAPSRGHLTRADDQSSLRAHRPPLVSARPSLA
jgi:hypothetical protein